MTTLATAILKIIKNRDGTGDPFSALRVIESLCEGLQQEPEPESNTFREYSAINKRRAERWHRGSIESWSLADWSNAMAGEAGEVCNAVKKFRRLEDKLVAHDGDTPQPQNFEAARAVIGKEIGDVFAYLDLLAQRVGLDTWTCVRDTFNQISKREGFPERV